jgi:hypothetical protein
MIRGYSLNELVDLVQGSVEELGARFPCSWLVWEAGPRTLGFDQSGPEVLLSYRSDAQCHALDGELVTSFVRVGRSSQCDVVINDATVSRVHLGLARDQAESWTVVPLSTGCFVGAEALSLGGAHRFTDGDQLRVGEVLLSYYGPSGMAKRLLRRERPVPAN